MEKKDRIVLLDFLRGVLLVWVMVDHFLYDAGFIYGDKLAYINSSLKQFGYNYYVGGYRNIAHPIVLFLFFIISGICTNFSKSATKGAIRLTIFWAVCTAVTGIFSLITNSKTFVVFGVLFVFMICGLINIIIQKTNSSKKVLLIVGVLLSLLGLFARYGVFSLGRGGFLFFFDEYGYGVSADYFPLLPYLGYFLIGIFLGKTFYKQKTPYVKLNKKLQKGILPITFIGKTSIWWYFASQVVFIIIFEIITR